MHLCFAVVANKPYALQVSDTHRLDDNKAERKRCEAAGSEVCKSTVDGKPVGPERVWPGGLAMSRTIGDHMVSPAAMLSSTSTNPAKCVTYNLPHKQPIYVQVQCTSACQQPIALWSAQIMLFSMSDTLKFWCQHWLHKDCIMKLLQFSCNLSLSCLGKRPQASSLYYNCLSCVCQPSRLRLMR